MTVRVDFMKLKVKSLEVKYGYIFSTEEILP